MKILVADDDAVSRSMMRRMLVQSGYEVQTATNGAEAVEILLAPNGPRLVLLDWMMPELDGPAVCEVIRRQPARPYTYITLLTSKESKEDLVAGLEAGADDYLTKPCNLEELRARLRTGQRILSLEDILVKAREEMRFKATHDALTLLLDRGAILQALACSLGESSQREFSVVLCDVDHFKRINDSYGHPVGDEVLREIAVRLKDAVRESDSVGRYGGEEFLLILNNSGPQSLEQQVHRIWESIRSQPFMTSAGEIYVTISAGALNLSLGSIPVTSERILKAIDDALYEAKHAGRDRILTTTLAAPQGVPELVAALAS